MFTVDHEGSYRIFRARIRAASSLLPILPTVTRINARDASETGMRNMAALDHAQRLARNSPAETFLGVGEV